MNHWIDSCLSLSVADENIHFCVDWSWTLIGYTDKFWRESTLVLVQHEPAQPTSPPSHMSIFWPRKVGRRPAQPLSTVGRVFWLILSLDWTMQWRVPARPSQNVFIRHGHQWCSGGGRTDDKMTPVRGHQSSPECRGSSLISVVCMLVWVMLSR